MRQCTSVGTTSTGAALKPETAEQYEAGVKYQPNGFKSYITAAAFDLTKQNATQADPSDPTATYFVQKGEIEVKGFELEGVADFDNGWKLLGAYSHWDAEVTKDADASIVGNRPVRIPANIGSFWADYTFRYGALQGLGGGVGLRYVGDTYGDDANTLKVPSYYSTGNTLEHAALRHHPSRSPESLTTTLVLTGWAARRS